MPKLLRIVFVLLWGIGLSAQPIDLQENWALPLPGENSFNSPVLFPDEKYPTGIVLYTQPGSILRVNAAGQIIFDYSLGEPGGCNPAVGDLNADGAPEILAASVSGKIHCLSGEGKCLWTFPTQSRLDYTLVLADLDRDGQLEVLGNTKSGGLFCLNAEGRLRWKFFAEPNAGPPAVADLNGDGFPEIVFGTDLQKIFCLNHQGEYLWHREHDGDFGRSLPLICDLDGDGHREILLTRSEVCPNSAVIALNASGKILWEAPTTMHGYGPLAVVDFEGDGRQEILVVDKSTSIYCLDAQGKRRWERVLTGHGIFFAPAVADLDGNGTPELISGRRTQGAEQEKLTLLGAAGNVLNEVPLQGGGNSSPVVADLDRDGRLEIYLVTQSPGRLVQFEASGRGGQILWNIWQGNLQRTGCVPNPLAIPRPTLENAAPNLKPEKREHLAGLIGTNSVNLNPDSREKRLLQTRLISDGITTTLQFLPENATRCLAQFELNSPGESRLEFTFFDPATGQPVKKQVQTITSKNFVADFSRIQKQTRQIDSLEQSLGKIGEPDRELLDWVRLELDALQRYLKKQGQQFSQPESRAQFIETATRQRNQVDQRLRLLRFLAAQRGAGNTTPFSIWEDENPWDDPPLGDFPSGVADSLKIFALGNETETRALNLTNLGTRTLYLKIQPPIWQNRASENLPVRDVLEFRETLAVGTVRQTTVPDALPQLNEARTLVVPPFETRQLWLTFKTKNLASGDYFSRLTLFALGVENPARSVNLHLRVSPVRLPEKSRLSFYTWAHLGADVANPQSQRKLADLLEHGATVFGLSAPVQAFDASGQPEPVDWRAHDAWVRAYQGKGTMLVASFQHTIKTPAPMWSPDWEKAYQAAIKTYAAHLQSLGVDFRTWALYPVDEPWLTGMANVKVLYDCARLAKAVDPRIQVYCDPAGMPTPENSQELLPCVDIWMPMMDLLKRPDKSLLEFYQQDAGAQVWAYEAPGPTKLLKPLGLYRMQPWLAFRYGLTGCGMWTYNFKDMWPTQQPAPFHHSYSIIYEDGHSIVTSRRWEAYRDGVEDFNLLTLLHEAIAAAPDSLQRRNAAHLLETAVREVTAKQEMANSNSRLNIEYDPDFGELMRFRGELIRVLEGLRE